MRVRVRVRVRSLQMVPRLTQVEGEAEGVVHEHLVRYGFGSAAQG